MNVPRTCSLSCEGVRTCSLRTCSILATSRALLCLQHLPLEEEQEQEQEEEEEEELRAALPRV